MLIRPDNLDEDADQPVHFKFNKDEHPKIGGQMVLPR